MKTFNFQFILIKFSYLNSLFTSLLIFYEFLFFCVLICPNRKYRFGQHGLPLCTKHIKGASQPSLKVVLSTCFNPSRIYQIIIYSICKSLLKLLPGKLSPQKYVELFLHHSCCCTPCVVSCYLCVVLIYEVGGALNTNKSFGWVKFCLEGYSDWE